MQITMFQRANGAQEITTTVVETVAFPGLVAFEFKTDTHEFRMNVAVDELLTLIGESVKNGVQHIEALMSDEG